MSGGYFEYRNNDLIWIVEKILEWKNNIDEIGYEHKEELRHYCMKVCGDTRKLYDILKALDYFLSNDTCEETFIELCKEVYGESND